MYILGISAYHPDSSAAIVCDGKLIAACEEERFTRIKHFAGFPSQSIKFCLQKAGISAQDLDYIVIPRDTKARLIKKIFYALRISHLAEERLLFWKKTSNISTKMPEFLNSGKAKIKAKIINLEHHRCHLSSSFFVSNFDQAFLFSADASGDFASTVWGKGEGNKIKILGEIGFPHSLGFYYTAITQYLGFLHFGDEYKVMGLASYGEPCFEEEFKKILKIKNNVFELGLEYFSHHKKIINVNFDDSLPDIGIFFSEYLEKRLGKRRLPGEPIEKRHQDIAATLQKRLEDVIIHCINSVSRQGTGNLCLSGGVAFNCVANTRIMEKTGFKNIYLPPSPGDAGLAIGGAFYFWNEILNNPRKFVMEDAYWGPGYTNDEIEKELSIFKDNGYKIESIEDPVALCKKTAQYISQGKIIGWFQGNMEWGPRALGNRSIIADPRKQEMKDILNRRIKHRESFRPFAPSVLEEFTAEYFEHIHPSPFMNFAYKVKEDKIKMIPAVTHIDGTARLQTVNRNSNPLYWQLISEFKELTGVPVILNTSFNDNEPIVCNPQEAIKCFLETEMNMLVIGKFIIEKD